MKQEIKDAIRVGSRSASKIFTCKLCGKEYYDRDAARYCVSSNHRKTWKATNRGKRSIEKRSGLMSYVSVRV